MDHSVSETIDQKMYRKKFRGGFSPLSPPGSAYDFIPTWLHTLKITFNLDFVIVW